MLKVKFYYINKTTPADTAPTAYELVAEYPIDNLSYTQSATEIPVYTFTISLNYVENNFPLREDNRRYLFKIYDGTTFLATGYTNNFTVDLIQNTINMSCDDLLYDLTLLPAIPYFVFDEEEQLLNVIHYILDQSHAAAYAIAVPDAAWTLADLGAPLYETEIENLLAGGINPAMSARCDLKAERNVFSQINKFLDQFDTPIYFKYNIDSQFTLVSNLRLLELYTPTREVDWVYDENNISNISYSYIQESTTSIVVPYGAEYKVAGVPTLLTIANKSKSRANFPSSTVDNWVKSTNKYQGGSKTEIVFFDDVKLKDDPGVNQKKRGSDALYIKAIKYLQRAANKFEFTLTSDEIPNGLQIGDRVRVQIEPKSILFDSITNTARQNLITNLGLNSQYYVRTIAVSYTNNIASYTLTLTDTPDFRSSDSDTKVYTSARSRKADDQSTTYVNTLPSTYPRYGYYEFTIGPGLAPNSTIFGQDSYRYTLAKIADADFDGITTPPTGVSIVETYQTYSPTARTQIAFTGGEEPQTANANFHVQVQQRHGPAPIYSWTTASQATVKVVVQFEP